MNFKELKIIIKQIQTSIPCPECNKCYTDEDIEIIGHLGMDQTFFHAFCEECELESIVNVTLQHENCDHDHLSMLPELFDGRLHNFTKVDMNSALDMKNFLKDFKGDFKSLFNTK